LTVYLLGLFGNSTLGVYFITTETAVFVPPQISETNARKLEECLQVKALKTLIGKSTLIGALASANSKGITLPHFAGDDEINAIKSTLPDINVAVMETKRTAYGNMVLSNDKGAIVDPRLKRKDLANISDALDVEVVSGEIAGLPYVGSLATATNKGVLAHPLLKEEERTRLTEVLKVPVDVGTINCGVPYVGTGLIANTHGAVAGFVTTGPELFIIEETLDLVNPQ
jgi:translation initiation factor 6